MIKRAVVVGGVVFVGICLYLAGWEAGDMAGRENRPTSVACYIKPDEDGHIIPRGQRSCWVP